MSRQYDNYGRDQFNFENVRDVYAGGMPVQQQVSVLGLEKIPPKHDRESWIERVQPQAELLQRIQKTPLIEIVAQGGFGKTLLAAWFYDRMQGEYDKALWVNFRKAPRFSQFALWVLQEIGFLVQNPQVTDEELISELIYRLIGRRVLIVMDQLEVIETAPDREVYTDFLQNWQQQGRSSVVLVTTRSRFGQDTLSEFELFGLTEAEGANFFASQQITTQVEQGFERLVQLANGQPLLLKLAASWLRQEANSCLRETDLEFFQQLFRRYPGNSDAKVAEIFAQLFAELSERLQWLLMNVVVYRDPFDLEMAQAMVANASIEDLQALKQQAFLQSSDNRWTLHPLMQRLIQETAQKAGSEPEAHWKAISYFASKIKRTKESMSDCAEELEIFHHCCELGKYELACQILETCVDFLEQRGYYRNLLPVYERLIRDWTIVNSEDIEQQRNLGWVWIRLGNLYQALGQYLSAILAHEQAQNQFNEISFAQGKAISLNNLGNAYNSLGQYQRAIDFHQQSLKIKREIGDRGSEANSFGNLGNSYRSLGQYQRAIDFHQQHYEISCEIGDRRGEAISLGSLGSTYYSLGQYQRAIDFHQQHYKISCEIGDRRGEAKSLGNLGNAYDSLGQHQLAIDFYQQSLEIAREIGDRQGEASSLGNLGVGYQSLGKYQRAIDFHQQHYEIAREIGDRYGEANSLFNLSNIYQIRGQFKRSRSYRHQAYRIWQELNLPLEALPLSEFQKRLFRLMGDDWIEQQLDVEQKLAWFYDTLSLIFFLIRSLLSPIRWLQRRLRHQK